MTVSGAQSLHIVESLMNECVVFVMCLDDLCSPCLIIPV